MAKNWIPLRQVEGTASRQAHVRLPEGTYEREISKEGFFGPSAQFHHRHKPTDWLEFEGAIRPRAFDLGKLAKAHANPWHAELVMANAHLQMRIWKLDRPMDELARNSDGDQLLFIHEGEGALFCDYGHLDYRDGDYVVIPRGTMWRLSPTKPTVFLMVEATNDHFTLPEKGLVGRHAIFDPAMLDTPHIDDAFRAQQDERAWKVSVKRRSQLSTVTFPFNPLDAVGWHGDLSVVRINWRDLRPLMSHRAHLPPSAHTTFMAGRFVVCTFVPRPLESDPEALRLPFFHNNDDFEEIIFYHKGSFFSRDNIHPGMMTVHPSGFTHGPHPKAFTAATKGGKTETDEVAVMIDTRDAVDVAAMPAGVEFEGYVHSWRAPELKQAAGIAMKLGSLKEGGRDGTLIVVNRALTRAVKAAGVAPTLQNALDDWVSTEPKLKSLAKALEDGKVPGAFDLDTRMLAAPLPRAYQWADGSAYVVHVELVRRARGVEMPPSFWTDPLMYQGGSDLLIGPNDDIEAADEASGIDFEGEIGVIVDDVPMGVSPEAARRHIKLVTIFCNDVSLRNVIVTELAKGFGFFHGKPATAFAPVAVTPDELGEAWDGAKLELPLISTLNGKEFGHPNAATDLTFDFGQLIAHAAKTRQLEAGTIVGSGTVANRDPAVGCSCIAERRVRETIDSGKPVTPFMKFGDRIRIEMLDRAGRSFFGAIDQKVVRYSPPG